MWPGRNRSLHGHDNRARSSSQNRWVCTPGDMQHSHSGNTDT